MVPPVVRAHLPIVLPAMCFTVLLLLVAVFCKLDPAEQFDFVPAVTVVLVLVTETVLLESDVTYIGEASFRKLKSCVAPPFA